MIPLTASVSRVLVIISEILVLVSRIPFRSHITQDYFSRLLPSLSRSFLIVKSGCIDIVSVVLFLEGPLSLDVDKLVRCGNCKADYSTAHHT